MLGGRIVVVETVYHQAPGEQASSSSSRFSKVLKTGEQVYNRRLKVSGYWQKLDLGWLTGHSMLCLANEGDGPLTVNPTEEEQARREGLTVEVGFTIATPGEEGGDEGWQSEPVPVLLVAPGESLRCTLADPSQVWLRCSGGETRVNLFLFPS